MYVTRAKRSHAHVKDPVVHGRVWWVMETPQTTQHALKVFQMWKFDTVQKKTEESTNYSTVYAVDGAI